MIVRLILCFVLSSPLTLMAGEPVVRMTTNLGDIVIELDREAAPVTVENFLGYVDDGSYNNTIFHRVIPGFMVQGGGYDADLTEVPENEPIRNEADNGLSNRRGSIAMARMTEIDSAGRQFFINTVNNRQLDHQRKSCTREDEAAAKEARARGLRKPQSCKSFGYAVFGRVIDGMDVVDQIEDTKTRTLDEFDDVPVIPITILSISREPEKDL